MAKKSSKKEKVVVEEIEVIDVDNKEKEENIDKKLRNKNIKMTMLVVQFFLSIITLVFVVLFLFKKSVLAGLQISLALTLFVTGINNMITYKRKFFTILYFLLGLVLAVLAVLTILGV